MKLFDTVAILLTVAALFSYINYKYGKLPRTISLMIMTLIVSFAMIILKFFQIIDEQQIKLIVQSIDFNKTLLEWMLCFLLFAGSIHVNVNELIKYKWSIGIFSTISLLISTILIGVITHYFLLLTGINISFIYCLLFGSLISPTDPIAVMGILKKAGLPKDLEINIVSESLFNDGVGVVLFVVLLNSINSGNINNIDLISVSKLFFQEAIGGSIFGLLLGLITYKTLKSIDDYQVEIMITLAVVTGGYALASKLGISGPLAIIFSGLVIGNHGNKFDLSEKSREHLYLFWELVDEILNAILFILIGIEVLVLKVHSSFVIPALVSIPIVLLARFISIGIPIKIFKKLEKSFDSNSTKIMTWAGLRGGLAVALALSINSGYERDLILTMTYSIVIFSIIVQGLTIKYLIKKD
ncbi:MAG: sodium:proton antiporter [Candidatus Sericytochromatia bacterium]|nr:sodium:proton antiporter [Candidatus Sericytochromatia bacterium]